MCKVHTRGATLGHMTKAKGLVIGNRQEQCWTLDKPDRHAERTIRQRGLSSEPKYLKIQFHTIKAHDKDQQNNVVDFWWSKEH